MIQDGMRDLTQQMQKKDGGAIPLQLRQAKVTAITGDTLTVTLDGTSITDVRKLAGYGPSVNDTIWLLQNGGDLLAIDRTGSVWSIAYRTASQPPGDYPRGITIMSVDGTGQADGWPANYGTVITFHMHANRIVQEFVQKDTLVRHWRTGATQHATGWYGWKTLADSHTHTEDSGWQEITDLRNGATAYQTGLAGSWTPRYRKVNGIVYLQGLINTNATTTTLSVAVLPVGFRPRNTYMGIINTSSAYYRRMDIDSNGIITFREGNTYTSAWHSINASFPADN